MLPNGNVMSVIAIARWVTLAVAAFGFAAEFAHTAESPEASTPPAELAGFFAPPEKYRSDFGRFHSPLVFAHGRLVRTPADWQRRRAEIRSTLHKIMGPLPALIEKP